MRFQFPLYKLFLIMAAYAAAFGAFCHLGPVGILIGAFVGTAGSGLILAFKTKKDLLSVVIVATGSLIGVFFSLLFIPAWQNRYYGVADLVRDLLVMSIGAIFGGLLFSWASKR